MNNWINIKDKLPDEEQKILILSRNKPEKGRYFRGEFVDEDIVGIWQDVTHWMPVSELIDE